MVETVRESGFRGLYKGWGITVSGLAPFVGIKFTCFDTLKRMFPERTAGFTMLLGALSGGN
jgi:hypothetical protein